MAVTDFTLTLNIAWSQARPNTLTGATIQSGQSNSGISNVDLTRWNEIYQDAVELSSGVPTFSIDLQDLLNYVSCAEFSLGKVLALKVRNLGNVDSDGNPIGGTDGTSYGNGIIRYIPGVSNPATLFFDASTNAINLPPRRSFAVADDDLMALETCTDDMNVDSTHKNLSLEWVSGSEAVVEIVVYGSTLLT